MIQNVVTQEQLNASLVTSNNKQFDFEYDAENDEYGYMLDGEFHPFGNPYLKWDEENGKILALDTDGNWVEIYSTNNLPIDSEFVIYDSNVWSSGYSLGSTANVNSGTWWVSDGGWTNSTSGLMSYITNSASNHAYHDTNRINGTVDLSNFRKLHMKLTVNGVVGSYEKDISDLDLVVYMMITHYGVSSGDAESVRVSLCRTNNGYVDDSIAYVSKTYSTTKQTVYINKIWFTH